MKQKRTSNLKKGGDALFQEGITGNGVWRHDYDSNGRASDDRG